MVYEWFCMLKFVPLVLLPDADNLKDHFMTLCKLLSLIVCLRCILLAEVACVRS